MLLEISPGTLPTSHPSHNSRSRRLPAFQRAPWCPLLISVLPQNLCSANLGTLSQGARTLKMRLFPRVSCSCSSSGPAAGLLGPSLSEYCLLVPLSPCWRNPWEQGPQLALSCGCRQSWAPPPGPGPGMAWGDIFELWAQLPRPGHACGPWVLFVSFKKGVTEWWLRGGTISLY